MQFDDVATNGTEWMTEKGELVKLRKGGFVSIADILSQQYTCLLPEYYLRPFEAKYISMEELEMEMRKVRESVRSIAL